MLEGRTLVEKSEETSPPLISSDPLSGFVMKRQVSLTQALKGSPVKGAALYHKTLALHPQRGSEWVEFCQETMVLMAAWTRTSGEVPPHLEFPHLPREECCQRRLLTALTWGSEKCEGGQCKEMPADFRGHLGTPRKGHISF